MTGIDSAAVERAVHDDRMHAAARGAIDAAAFFGTAAGLRLANWAVDAACDAAAARGGWRASLRRRRMLALRGRALGLVLWGGD